jgi:hypothetical protein
MIFLIKKTKGMNLWNSSKRIIKNTASTTPISKKTSKKRTKTPGNNTCANNKKSNKNTMKNKKECMSKWVAKIIHSLQILITRST